MDARLRQVGLQQLPARHTCGVVGYADGVVDSALCGMLPLLGGRQLALPSEHGGTATDGPHESLSLVVLSPATIDPIEITVAVLGAFTGWRRAWYTG